jgi:hypothetical protein
MREEFPKSGENALEVSVEAGTGATREAVESFMGRRNET